MTANTVTVNAGNKNDFVVTAKGKVKGIKVPNLGEASGVAVSLMESTADAVVAGKVTTQGDVVVNGESVNLNNDTVAIGSVKKKPGGISGKVAEKSGRENLKPASDPGQNSLGAAVAFAKSTNSANAKISPANPTVNTVSTLGDLFVTSRAEDNFKVVAMGSARPRDTSPQRRKNDSRDRR